MSRAGSLTVAGRMLFQISSAAVANATASLRLGVDVGGTFTDVILHAPGRPRHDPQGPLDAAELRRARSWTPSRRSRTAPPPGRRGRARDDRRDERRARAARRARRRSSRRGLPRRARAAAHAHARTSTTSSGRSRRRSSAPRSASRWASGWRADGTVVRPLDEDEARARRGDGCARQGVESVAVCLLHSHLYPAHEQRLGAILREELPGVTDLAVERDPPRAAGVRAIGDDRRQRLRAAADGALPRPTSATGSTPLGVDGAAD